jgi:hypothetical protein
MPAKGYQQMIADKHAQWKELRSTMPHFMVEIAYPTSFSCSLCGNEAEKKAIIRCMDCGPSAYYCSSCASTVHNFITLHAPEQWNPKVQFQLYIFSITYNFFFSEIFFRTLSC